MRRMTSVNASTRTFDRPQYFDLKQFDDNGLFGYGDGTKIRLVFRIEKEAGLAVVECPLSFDQEVVELDDAYDITATVVESAMLKRWLWGFENSASGIRKKIEDRKMNVEKSSAEEYAY